MPVDPQIQVLLDKGTGVPATHTLSVDVARAQYEARIALMASPAEIASVREQTIDGPGGPLRIRIYTPHGTRVLHDRMPVCSGAGSRTGVRSTLRWRRQSRANPSRNEFLESIKRGVLPAKSRSAATSDACPPFSCNQNLF